MMLLIGMPLDLPPPILLLTPIFVQLAATIGSDPVQLGLIMILDLGISNYRRPWSRRPVHLLFDRRNFAQWSNFSELSAFFAVSITLSRWAASQRSPCSLEAGSSAARK